MPDRNCTKVSTMFFSGVSISALNKLDRFCKSPQNCFSMLPLSQREGNQAASATIVEILEFKKEDPSTCAVSIGIATRVLISCPKNGSHITTKPCRVPRRYLDGALSSLGLFPKRPTWINPNTES